VSEQFLKGTSAQYRLYSAILLNLHRKKYIDTNELTNMSTANSKQVRFKCLQNVVLVTHERTPVGKGFHTRGPDTEKALSLRCR